MNPLFDIMSFAVAKSTPTKFGTVSESDPVLIITLTSEFAFTFVPDLGKHSITVPSGLSLFSLPPTTKLSFLLSM